MSEAPTGTAPHSWVGATTVPIEPSAARSAHRRGTMRVPATTTVEVLEVYCSQCRRPFAAVAAEPCVIGVHLHGGRADGSRKKRGHPRDTDEDTTGVAV